MKNAVVAWTVGALAIAALTACSKSEVSRDPGAALRQADSTPEVWLSHGRTYDEQRYSPLDQISPDTIAKLGLAWAFDLGVSRGIEATPIVADGRIYVTATWNIVYALNAKSGEQIWRFDPQVDRSKAADMCCDAVNRGVALWGDRIFIGTIDGRLIALDAKTGRTLWDVVTVDQSKPYSITGAPRIVNGKVIIGNGGAEFGVRGYVSAYDVNTGERLWRFHTVPGNPAEGFESEVMEKAAETWTGQWWKFGGGGTVWDSMAYDPELDLLYIGVGNGSPWNQSIRSPEGGDNLFLSSIVALRPDTGEYVWHYQTTPGETWDYTATQHMILADLKIDGETRKVIAGAENGFFYVIDRATGELISANNYVPVNWATHIDPESGRPVEIPEARWGSREPYLQLPGPLGGHNWHPMSYSPRTGLVYIPAMETPYIYGDDPNFRRSEVGWNMGANPPSFGSLPDDLAQFKALLAAVKGRLLAWDPVAQKPAWKVEHNSPWNGGVLSTAGGLVFQGNADAKLVAYRADTGERLWDHFAQTGIVAAPISYAIDGEQYIAVASGWGGAFTLIYGGLFPAESAPGVGRLLVFKLGGKAQLPAIPERRLGKPELPEPIDDNAMVAEGKRLYDTNCLVCHGDHAISSGLLPDLRWTPLLGVADAWHSVVIDGARASQGMPSFKPDLDRADSQAIRAYVISAAHSGLQEKLQNAEPEQ